MEFTITGVSLNNIYKHIVEIKNKLDEFGVVILSEVFPKNKCDKYVEQSYNWLSSVNPKLTRKAETWTNENIPSGPRRGMYQSIISHCPIVWKLREKLYPLFSSLHGTKELITSVDGATFMPPLISSYKDWPHIDQTSLDQSIYSIQGQVVLTDTTASFRCTPKSHLKHQELVHKYDMDQKNQWYKFNETNELEEMFDQWQIPIHSKKGSVILWNSKTIHSAKYVDDPKIYDSEKSWDGWRCVYYICQRPRTELTKRNLNTLRNAAMEGRTTNHWGIKMFPKKQRWDQKCPEINQILENPEKLVQPLSELQKFLVGLN